MRSIWLIFCCLVISVMVELPSVQPDSRLFKAIGRPHIGNLSEERHGPSGICYYEWNNNRLCQVKFTPSVPILMPTRRTPIG